MNQREIRSDTYKMDIKRERYKGSRGIERMLCKYRHKEGERGGVGGEKVRKSDVKCEQRRENMIKRRRYTREKERES